MKSQPTEARVKLYRFAGVTIACALVLLHLLMPMLTSGGDAVPGDLGDSRLNNLILEHGYLSLLGYYEYSSPGQFFPVQNTLYFSENLLASLLFYVPFRELGITEMASFQLMLIVTILLNTISFYFLLSILKIDQWISLPIVFFSLSFFGWISQLVHPQLLPVYPFILSLSFLFSWIETSKFKHLTFFLGSLVWQHLSSIYLGVFSTCIAISLVSILFFFSESTKRNIIKSVKRDFKKIVLVVSTCVLSLILLYRPYASISSNHGTNPIQDIETLSPTFGSWFSAPEQSYLYGKQSFVRDASIPVEVQLFGGWLIWPILAAIFCFPGRFGACKNYPAALAMVCTIMLAMAGITAWHLSGGLWSPYLALCRVFPALKAIRAVGRISLLLHILAGTSAAVLLQCLADRRNRNFRIAAVALAFAMAVEGLSTPGLSFSKTAAEQRLEPLLAGVPDGSAPAIIAYLTRPDTEPVLFSHLDAWMAAMRRRTVTVNGYSGRYPESHEAFYNRPDRATLAELLARFGIDPARVIVVYSDR